jgi:hypothetical protein
MHRFRLLKFSSAQNPIQSGTDCVASGVIPLNIPRIQRRAEIRFFRGEYPKGQRLAAEMEAIGRRTAELRPSAHRCLRTCGLAP